MDLTLVNLGGLFFWALKVVFLCFFAATAAAAIKGGQKIKSKIWNIKLHLKIIVIIIWPHGFSSINIPF